MIALFDQLQLVLVGTKINREGHLRLLTHSVRQPDGENVVIFNPNVLSNPRKSCQLTYRIEGNFISVERQLGVNWITLDVRRLCEGAAW
jgi:hypothetical protein